MKILGLSRTHQVMKGLLEGGKEIRGHEVCKDRGLELLKPAVSCWRYLSNLYRSSHFAWPNGSQA